MFNRKIGNKQVHCHKCHLLRTFLLNCHKIGVSIYIINQDSLVQPAYSLRS